MQVKVGGTPLEDAGTLAKRRVVRRIRLGHAPPDVQEAHVPDRQRTLAATLWSVNVNTPSGGLFSCLMKALLQFLEPGIPRMMLGERLGYDIAGLGETTCCE